ncbi:MAG: N-acyl-D-amino-acid deacylase family protein [Nitrososphaeria archaeon]
MEAGNIKLVIRNGEVADGTGRPTFKADILISNSKITKVGRIESSGDKEVDANGLIVSPGFINIHDHSDSILLSDGRAKSLIMQGVTTTVIGNCGYSLAPVNEKTMNLLVENWLFPITNLKISWRSFAEFLCELEKKRLWINVAALVGHGTIRVTVLGMDNRKPNKEELKEMKKLTYEAMESGSFGLSSGLAYPPGCYATTEEIIELCKEVAKFDGLYTIHTRKEALGFLDGIREAIEICERSGARLQISHIETHYPSWGEESSALNLVDLARISGFDVGCDVIPYLWSATSLYTLLPKWTYAGGPKEMVKRVSDKKIKEKIKNEVLNLGQELTTGAMAKDGLWDKIRILSCPRDISKEGKTIEEIATSEGKEPFESMFDLLSLGPPFPSIMAQSHNEEDLIEAVKFQHSTIESDFYAISQPGSNVNVTQHPRGFGTFPLIFRKYVRGEIRAALPEEPGRKILSLEEAIRKITSLPAQRLKLEDRGTIKEGMQADIVIFDKDRISDKATYKNPCVYPEGIEYVIVNGEIAVKRGRLNDCASGKILRRGAQTNRKNNANT